MGCRAVKAKRAAAQLSLAAVRGPLGSPEEGAEFPSCPPPVQLLGELLPTSSRSCSVPGTAWGLGRSCSPGKHGQEHYPDLTRHSWVLQTSFRRIERKGSLSCGEERGG